MPDTIQEVGDGSFVDEGVTYDVQANIELSWLSPDQSGALAESFGGFLEFPATADEAVHTGASLDHFETVIQHNPAMTNTMDVDEQAEVARIRDSLVKVHPLHRTVVSAGSSSTSAHSQEVESQPIESPSQFLSIPSTGQLVDLTMSEQSVASTWPLGSSSIPPLPSVHNVGMAAHAGARSVSHRHCGLVWVEC